MVCKSDLKLQWLQPPEDNANGLSWFRAKYQGASINLQGICIHEKLSIPPPVREVGQAEERPHLAIQGELPSCHIIVPHLMSWHTSFTAEDLLAARAHGHRMERQVISTMCRVLQHSNCCCMR